MAPASRHGRNHQCGDGRHCSARQRGRLTHQHGHMGQTSAVSDARGHIYLAGKASIDDHLFRYEIASSTWMTLTTVPSYHRGYSDGGGAGMTLGADGRLYFIGGLGSSKHGALLAD